MDYVLISDRTRKNMIDGVKNPNTVVHTAIVKEITGLIIEEKEIMTTDHVKKMEEVVANRLLTEITMMKT